jgi:hypothetical protein
MLRASLILFAAALIASPDAMAQQCGPGTAAVWTGAGTECQKVPTCPTGTMVGMNNAGAFTCVKTQPITQEQLWESQHMPHNLQEFEALQARQKALAQPPTPPPQAPVAPSGGVRMTNDTWCRDHTQDQGAMALLKCWDAEHHEQYVDPSLPVPNSMNRGLPPPCALARPGQECRP